MLGRKITDRVVILDDKNINEVVKAAVQIRLADSVSFRRAHVKNAFERR